MSRNETTEHKNIVYNFIEQNPWIEVLEGNSIKIEGDSAKPEIKSINKYIEHTLLKQTVVREDIRKLCSEAIDFDFAGVCVSPYYVPYASNLLIGNAIKLVSVVGFPLGQNSTEIKLEESKYCVSNGCSDIDMVINISALKDCQYKYVFDEIKAIKDTIGYNIYLKVIIETAFLSLEEKIIAGFLAKIAGANCIKTSTGFAATGASLTDVEMFYNLFGDTIDIKASGGIRDTKTALDFVIAGAKWLGTSSSVNIARNTFESNSN